MSGTSTASGLTRAELDALTRSLTDAGLLIEAGFAGLRAVAIDRDAPPDQLHEMRLAFFAGAQHLFGSIMSILDPGTDPTVADMSRMGQIHTELERFVVEFTKRHQLPTQGHA